MLKLGLASLGLAALLSACTPALTAATSGRIVNAATGEQGTVSFLPGALRPQPPGQSGNNVTLVIGGQSYVGRAAVLEGGPAASGTGSLGLSLGFGASVGSAGSGWGLAARVGTPPAPSATLRSGNLIARTAGAAPRTLTCTLQVDTAERGFGECSGEGGVRYVLQF
ncbi:hypothetical protein [Deinococcus budaensis]|uniref:Uncharacterized protein n=1 Tax=Deinococcus budaensis TaxID=1665626 RepID=A0A7W8GDQ2_9DEIO|nr:hypothetical protein [Deinococcus budaensis]MBB5233401.1 hypothetical protein [Deinococcus budaensis]